MEGKREQERKERQLLSNMCPMNELYFYRDKAPEALSPKPLAQLNLSEYE